MPVPSEPTRALPDTGRESYRTRSPDPLLRGWPKASRSLPTAGPASGSGHWSPLTPFSHSRTCLLRPGDPPVLQGPRLSANSVAPSSLRKSQERSLTCCPHSYPRAGTWASQHAFVLLRGRLFSLPCAPDSHPSRHPKHIALASALSLLDTTAHPAPLPSQGGTEGPLGGTPPSTRTPQEENKALPTPVHAEDSQ